MGSHSFNIAGTGSNSIKDAEAQNSVWAGNWDKVVEAPLTFIPLQHHSNSPHARHVKGNLKILPLSAITPSAAVKK